MTITELEQDINYAIHILYGGGVTDEEKFIYGKIYPWTNEGIEYYYNYKDLTGKKVYTITGSGDHNLYVAAAGATEIDSTDANRLAKYYASLKVASVLTYTEEVFLKNFNITPDTVINQFFELENVKPYLPKYHDIFWQEVMATSAFKNNRKLFRGDGKFKPPKLDYDTLRRNLEDVTITYFDKRFNDFAEETDELYDAGFVSNIGDWFSPYLPDQQNYLLNGYYLLKKDGVLYDYYKLRDRDVGEIFLPDKKIICEPIENANNDCICDTVFVYKKR